MWGTSILKVTPCEGKYYLYFKVLFWLSLKQTLNFKFSYSVFVSLRELFKLFILHNFHNWLIILCFQDPEVSDCRVSLFFDLQVLETSEGCKNSSLFSFCYSQSNLIFHLSYSHPSFLKIIIDYKYPLNGVIIYNYT